jgi:hypothetical protein
LCWFHSRLVSCYIKLIVSFSYKKENRLFSSQRLLTEKKAKVEIHKFINWLLCLIILVIANACAPVHKTTREEAFNFSVLETNLQRGISTMEDVRRLFGDPNGQGGMLLIPRDPKPLNVWFYEKMEIAVEGNQMDVKQDVMLIFFKGGCFDGYWWFSDAAKN